MRGNFCFLIFASAFVIYTLFCSTGQASPLSLTIYSPEEGENYETSPVSLLWSADETVGWAWYSLNGGANVSLFSWSEQDWEDAYLCEGTFSESCSYAVDENWTVGSKCNFPGSCAIYENFTIPLSAKSANWTYKLYKLDGSVSYSVYYWNYTKKDWSVLDTTPVPEGYYTREVKIPSSGLSSGVLRIRNPIKHNAIEGQRYFEGKVEWFKPGNSTISSRKGVNFLRLYANDSAGNMTMAEVKYYYNPPEHSIQYILNMSSTQSNVYIPGTGVLDFSEMTNSIYSSPAHWYIASYLNGIVSALVFSGNTPNNIILNKTSSTHSISVSQYIGNSKALLAFTSGDWHSIDNRIESVESGTFLLEPMPSFAYGLGLNYIVKIILGYPDIDFSGNLLIGKGEHSINFENLGLSGRKVVIQASSV